MKRILSLSLIAALLVGLAGCQDDKAASASENDASATQAAKQTAPATETAANQATQQDERFAHGEKLVAEANCMKCHASRPFDPENSKVHDFGSLTTMVEACNTNLGIGWFPEEVQAAAHYLNRQYYHFEE